MDLRDRFFKEDGIPPQTFPCLTESLLKDAAKFARG